MTGLTALGHPSWLAALWLIPALALLIALAARRRRRLLHRFADDSVLPKISDRAWPIARAFKTTLLLTALALTTVALARPVGKPIPTPTVRTGHDVIFLIDVSKSMLAEDLAPNRLERAKLMVADTLRSLKGDRAALVAFAGTAVVKAPLTTDYGFVRMALDDLSTDSVSRGGSLIGDALRKTVAELVPKENDGRSRDIILITDGEDHDSFPVQAAQDAGERGVRIIAIGLGDPGAGAPVPVTDAQGRRTYLEYQGDTVRSRLDESMLRKVAATTPGGVYLPVREGTIKLDRVYQQLVSDRDRQSVEQDEAPRRQELFQWLLAGALALLFFEGLISERKKS